MLFINNVAVIPESAECAPAISGGYAVRMRLHNAERVEGFAPIYLFGLFTEAAATKMVREINSMQSGSKTWHGGWSTCGQIIHQQNEARIKDRMEAAQ